MLVKDLLTEASTPRRAWNGKLEKIDALMAWMYDKDILTASEKAKKDQVFRQYYRYYNDGDMPASLKTQGFNRHSDEKEVEAALEAYIEKFIKSILSKYLPRVDRTEFRLDNMISKLSTIISVADEHDAHGLLTYWLKTVKIQDSALKQLVDTLNDQYTALKQAANAADPTTENTTMSYRVPKMKAAKKWNKSLESQWNRVIVTSDKIADFLRNLQTSIKNLKKQQVIKPLQEAKSEFGDKTSISDYWKYAKWIKAAFEKCSDKFSTDEEWGKFEKDLARATSPAQVKVFMARPSADKLHYNSNGLPDGGKTLEFLENFDEFKAAFEHLIKR